MIATIPSNSANLDAVLGGGLPENSIALIAGAPGTGKTMLAQAYLFRNATPERPGLYLTTATEPLDKVIRYGQGLTFFDQSVVGSAVVYESLGDILATSGLPGVMERIVHLLATLRPAVLVIDSLKALPSYASDPMEHRRFIGELGARLSAVPTTTLWVGEYEYDELLAIPEAAVADAIITLRSVGRDQRSSRYLEVLKLRGSSYMSGQHAYRLTDRGLQVFPRLAETIPDAAAAAPTERLPLGTDGINAMVEGGVFAGSMTLVIGPSGAGKTMLALDFLAAGARQGHRAVYASLQERPGQMVRLLSRGGRTHLSEHVTFHHRSPVDIYVDEWVHEVFALLEATGAQLLVVDSLTDLRLAAPDEKRFEEYVYSLAQRTAALGVTILMTLESRPLFSLTAFGTSSLSNLADNLVIIGQHAEGGRVRRFIHMLKTRASGHDPMIREFTIEAGGIEIGEPLVTVKPDDGL
jgi:circadian clock protein KaiC